MAYIIMASLCIGGLHIAMACRVMTSIVLAYIGMAYIVMAYLVYFMAYIVMAYGFTATAHHCGLAIPPPQRTRSPLSCMHARTRARTHACTCHARLCVFAMQADHRGSWPV